MKKTIFFTTILVQLFFLSFTHLYSCHIKSGQEGTTNLYDIKAKPGNECTIGISAPNEPYRGHNYRDYDRGFIVDNKTDYRIYARIATESASKPSPLCKTSSGLLIPPKVTVTLYRHLDCKPTRVTGYRVDENNKKINNTEIIPTSINSTKHIRKQTEGSLENVPKWSLGRPGEIRYHPLHINITDQGDGTLKFEQKIIK